MKHEPSAPRLILAAVLLVASAVLLSACDGQSKAQLADQRQQIDRLVKQVNQLEFRVKTGRLAPDLKFRLEPQSHSIRERMYDPQAEGQAQLTVLGEPIPELIYVEVLIRLQVENGEPLEQSAIHRIEKGLGNIHWLQALPRHGLTPEQIQVSIEPVAWYFGHRIASD
jgi:hypothetical protein